MASQRLDMLGEMCPIPLIKAKQVLDKMSNQDTLTVVTDHSCVEANFSQSFLQKGYKVDSNEVMNGIWEIEIKKNV
ncbi:sulfurtransferase TusA family protein [Bacillota bacterium Lsc_1132]